ncbi:probable secreted glycoprotein [Natronomonas pharaonis DSM 2160]|uniref:Probable secreted glycoprotein n=1 Tax=Natronomonas pharaonis (strain ATCC 35678 / DSM 2160 / CIP 103997 / JCM 8858 / NBRC 14720 / NCIMB 2260 / Gabara) TaxID=348780 RepID=A0A1U7EXA5_NATPD|nr:hypothetical protein [Natronomonas pharaonis]CAI49785.1 probable secreted glycoprotein [Natronomonas pharaonis DSM 2160]
MRRRTYIALSGAALASLAGCSDDEGENGDGAETPSDPEPTPGAEATDDNEETTPRNDVEETAEDEDPTEPEETPEQDDDTDRSDAGTLLSVTETLGGDQPLFDADGIERLDGEGAVVTDEMTLGSGLTVVVFEHTGAGNVIIELEGDRTELLVNDIGATSGAVAVPTPAGSYRFDVDAGGEWSLQVGQPRAPAEAVRTPPVSATGTGSDVVGPVELNGSETVAGEHDGSMNFIVEGYGEAASTSLAGELLFNELGTFDGETKTDLAGVVWLDIEADSDWSLDVTPE